MLNVGSYYQLILTLVTLSLTTWKIIIIITLLSERKESKECNLKYTLDNHERFMILLRI